MNNFNKLYESMLLEFLDVNTGKHYEYTTSNDPNDFVKWSTPIVFEGLFKTDTGLEFAVRIFKEKRFGQHARNIVVMTKKSTKWNQNLFIEPGTFKKVAVTIFKIYSDYKDTQEGKMSSGFVMVMQQGISKYAGIMTKAALRAFKNNPLKKMEFMGATDEDPKSKNATLVFFANPASSYKPFEGKNGYKPEYATSELALSLIGSKSKEADAVAVSAEIATADVEDYSVGALAKQFQAAFQPAPVANLAPEETYVDIEPEKEPEYVPPEVGPKDIIEMLDNTGSSSITKGDKAYVLGVFDSVSQAQNTSGTVFSAAAKEKVKEGDKVVVLLPYNLTKKFVLIPLSAEVKFKLIEKHDPSKDVKVEPEKDEKLKNVPAAVKVSTKQLGDAALSFDAKSFNISTPQIADLMKVNLAGVDISVQDFSIANLAVKLKNMFEALGADPNSDAAKKKLVDLSSALEDKSDDYAALLHSKIVSLKMQFKSSDQGAMSVEAYTGSAYQSANRYLRGTNDGDYGKATVEGLDKAYSAAGVRFPDDMVVYRGQSMTDDEIITVNKKQRYKLVSYSSCSLRVQTAYSFSGMSSHKVGLASLTGYAADSYLQSKAGNKIMMAINKLSNCLSLYIATVSTFPKERELLLNRDTDLVLRDKELTLVYEPVSSQNVKGYYGNFSVVPTLNEAVLPKSFSSLLNEAKAIENDMNKINMMKFVVDLHLSELDTRENAV